MEQPEAIERFSKKYEEGPEGCWLWKAATTSNGYGRFWFGSSTKMVHRVAYRLLVGPIPDELQLDHLCRTRHCVNPEHLEPVTPKENKQRWAETKTHCVNGHEYTPENTHIKPEGWRSCRKCQREHVRRHRQRQQMVGA